MDAREWLALFNDQCEFFSQKDEEKSYIIKRFLTPMAKNGLFIGNKLMKLVKTNGI